MKAETKKVIFVLDSFWPNQDGVSTVVQYLSSGLAKRGHIVEVLTNAKDRDLPKEEVHEGVLVKRIRVETRWPFYFRAMDKESDIQAYREEIDKFNPDVVIVESLCSWTNDWFAVFANELTCKKILHLHSDIVDFRECGLSKVNYKVKNIGNILYQIRMQYKKRIYWKHIYRNLDRYDAVLYLSPGLPGIKGYEKQAKGKVCLLENAVDDIFFSSQMQHDMRREHSCRFLCVANYVERKNQAMLVQAYSQANFDYPTEMVFLGNGSRKYMEQLRSQADMLIKKEDSNKKITFYRGISRSETLDEYRKADVFVLSSKWEESPIVIREAAASRMAVISTDVGDVSQIPGCQIVHSEEEMARALEKNVEDIEYRNCQAQKLAIWAEENCKREKAVNLLENIMLQ